MLDNESDSKNPPLDTNQENQLTKSTAPDTQNAPLDFNRLTHQNWLFINAFLSSGNVKKAYQLAKYSGTEASAPYQIFRKLKPYIEQIGDLDVTSRARLQADLKPVLDMPLDPSKQHLTLSEWLRVRKFSASITPEAKTAKANISVLVINRPSKKDEPITIISPNGQKGTTQSTDSPTNNIINADLIVDDEDTHTNF